MPFDTDSPYQLNNFFGQVYGSVSDYQPKRSCIHNLAELQDVNSYESCDESRDLHPQFGALPS